MSEVLNVDFGNEVLKNCKKYEPALPSCLECRLEHFNWKRRCYCYNQKILWGIIESR